MASTLLGLAVSAVLAETGWVSLHTGDPGTTGAFEVTGAPYMRQAISWSEPSGGVVTNVAGAVVPLPPNVTITYFGLWNAQTAGDFAVGGALSAVTTTTTTQNYQVGPGALSFSVSATAGSLPALVAYLPYLVGLDGGAANTEQVAYDLTAGWGIPTGGGSASTIFVNSFDGGNA